MSNLNKDHLQMQKNNPPTHLIHKKGDWVVLNKTLENKTVEVKDGTQTWGIYEVLEPRGSIPTHVVIMNPWVGLESSFEANQNDLSI